MPAQFTDFLKTPDLSIALLSKAQMDEAVRLINHAFSYQDEAKGRERITLDELAKKIDETQFYVIKQHDKLVACISLELRSDCLYLGLLAVADRLQGGKLAPKIMQATNEYAKQLNYKRIDLSYGSASPWLREYYERYGYTETGDIRDIGWSKLIEMSKPL